MLSNLAPFIPQVSILVVLGAALTLFIRNRIRYDIVALLVMIAIIATGVLSFEDVFANLGHPAIIIVASMFVMSEAFVRSGIVDAIVGRMTFLHHRPIAALGFLVFLVAFISAFVNNAGALAMAIPIAIHLARKSNTPIALFLLPLAFASHLGGFTTLIGTPRNILISNFREETLGVPFAMFDFFYVGGAIALVGCVFLIAVSWRFIPLRRQGEAPSVVRQYTTEVTISPRSKVAKMTIEKFHKAAKGALLIASVYRNNQRLEPTQTLGLIPGDRLMLSGDIDALTHYTERFGLSLTGMRVLEQNVTNADDQVTVEAIVPPYARLVGTTWNATPLAQRFGTNFIGIFRRDAALTTELADAKIWPSDILLLHGRSETVNETIEKLRLLPIANSEINFGRTSTILVTLVILAISIIVASLNILPLALVFLSTSIIIVLLNLVSLRQAYDSIDPAILILLAGMITLGEALYESGAAESIASLMLTLGGFLGPALMLATVLIVSMLLSDFMNTTASAVVMAPIAILIAQSMNVSIDPFLIAVAIGASSAFLTPIGHESNAIVMRQGGYTFKDYFRVGLPLELLIVGTSIPLILYFWPF